MQQCGLDGIRAPYDANNGIRDAFSTTDIIILSLCYHYDIVSYFASVYTGQNAQKLMWDWVGWKDF